MGPYCQPNDSQAHSHFTSTLHSGPRITLEPPTPVKSSAKPSLKHLGVASTAPPLPRDNSFVGTGEILGGMIPANQMELLDISGGERRRRAESGRPRVTSRTVDRATIYEYCYTSPSIPKLSIKGREGLRAKVGLVEREKMGERPTGSLPGQLLPGEDAEAMGYEMKEGRGGGEEVTGSTTASEVTTESTGVSSKSEAGSSDPTSGLEAFEDAPSAMPSPRALSTTPSFLTLSSSDEGKPSMTVAVPGLAVVPHCDTHNIIPAHHHIHYHTEYDTAPAVVGATREPALHAYDQSRRTSRAESLDVIRRRRQHAIPKLFFVFGFIVPGLWIVGGWLGQYMVELGPSEDLKEEWVSVGGGMGERFASRTLAPKRRVVSVDGRWEKEVEDSSEDLENGIGRAARGRVRGSGIVEWLKHENKWLARCRWAALVSTPIYLALAIAVGVALGVLR
ncbi:hypothetical protein IAT38_006344 [Cryptococcus sp. DSM 104549]